MSRPRLSLKKEQIIESKSMISSDLDIIKVKFQNNLDDIQNGFFKPCHSSKYPPLLAKYEVAFSVFVRLTLKNAAEVRLVYENDKIIGALSLNVPEFAPISSCHSEILADVLISSYKHEREILPPRKFNSNGLTEYDELYSGIADSLRPRFKMPTFPKYENINFFNELKENKKFNREIHLSILKNILAYDEDILEKRLHLYLENEGLDLSCIPTYNRDKLLKIGAEDKLFDVTEPHAFIKHCMRLFSIEHQKFEKIVLSDPHFCEFFREISTQPDELLKIKKELFEMNQFNMIPHTLEHFDEQFQKISELLLVQSQCVGTQRKF